MLGTRNALLLLDVINCTKSVSQEELFEKSTPFEHLLQVQYAKDIFQFRLCLQISRSHQVAQKYSPVRCNFTIDKQLDYGMSYRFTRHFLSKCFLLSNFRFSLQLSGYRQV